jgi:hypothetical protein
VAVTPLALFVRQNRELPEAEFLDLFGRGMFLAIRTVGQPPGIVFMPRDAALTLRVGRDRTCEILIHRDPARRKQSDRVARPGRVWRARRRGIRAVIVPGASTGVAAQQEHGQDKKKDRPHAGHFCTARATRKPLISHASPQAAWSLSLTDRVPLSIVIPGL